MKETVMQSQAMDRLKKARAKMLVKHPFFATLMMSMPMIETTMIPTAATDMRQLFINPDFVASVDDDVLMFVIAHEIMHTALVHGMRLSGRDPTRWNVATDYAINLILKDSNFKVWEHALLDEKYRDLSADNIYNQLKKEDDEQQQPAAEAGSARSERSAAARSGPGQGQGGRRRLQVRSRRRVKGSRPGPTAGQPGSEHHSPMLGDLIKPEESGDPVAEDRLRKDIQQRVAQAASIARMTGNMPGSLERFVQQVLEPKVPWYETLRHLMTEHDKSTRTGCTATGASASTCRPTMPRTGWASRLAIGDTSGSIGDEELIDMGSEFTGICEDQA
jgi:predicted metal-dependent peptidase